MNKHNYIEFRVYLTDDADFERVIEQGDELHDLLIDFVCDSQALPIYTQDVTHEYHICSDDSETE